MRSIILIVHNVRSCHNVGSLFRTAEGLGVEKIYLTGYTPYPLTHPDSRLPHIAQKLQQQIHKTALGAEAYVPWQRFDTFEEAMGVLRKEHYSLVGLEQASNAEQITHWTAPLKTALVVGNEVDGLEPAVLKLCETVIQIPMRGKKESFNVVQAAAMALFYITYFPN